jgi:hypothetical protein
VTNLLPCKFDIDECDRQIQELQKFLAAKKIAPYLSLTDNKSHSFQIFIQGIQKLLLEVQP